MNAGSTLVLPGIDCFTLIHCSSLIHSTCGSLNRPLKIFLKSPANRGKFRCNSWNLKRKPGWPNDSKKTPIFALGKRIKPGNSTFLDSLDSETRQDFFIGTDSIHFLLCCIHRLWQHRFEEIWTNLFFEARFLLLSVMTCPFLR